MLGFLRNFVGIKTDNAVQAGVEALVRWDPQGASEAELRTMEQHLDELGQQVAAARQDYDRERQEAEQIEALSRQRMAAAEQLQGQIATEADPARRALLGAQPRNAGHNARGDDARSRAREEGRGRRQGFPRDARKRLCRGRRQAQEAPVPNSTAPAATWCAPASSARPPSGRPTRRGRRPGLTRSTSSLNVALRPCTRRRSATSPRPMRRRPRRSCCVRPGPSRMTRTSPPRWPPPPAKSPAPQNLSERLAALRARAER